MRSIRILIFCCLSIPLVLEDVKSQHFVDIGNELNIAPSYLSDDNWGAGLSFFDVNQDGWDDLTFARDFDSLLVYFNFEGDFSRVAIPLPEFGKLKNATWADYDNDGDMDLFLSFYSGHFYLMQNNGEFEFTDVTAATGLTNLPAQNYGITLADLNRDGYLDVLISRYSGIPSAPGIQKFNLLYIANGDGTFSNATFNSGLLNTVRPTFLSVLFDYDKNGWPDIYEINDRTPSDNIMHKNLGEATFVNATDESNSAFTHGHPMTATVGDYNNDGYLDVFMTNSTYSPSLDITTTLLKNEGTGYFSDVSENTGLDLHLFSWGAVWIDVDNDGLQDLYIATSPIVSNAAIYKDLFFKQNTDHTFSQDSTFFPGINAQRNYAVARGDLNNDGFYDIVTHSISPYESNVWLNSGNENHFIKISLEGMVSNRMAIGAWIQVCSNDTYQYQYIMCGENYISQNSQHHIFGLGSTSIVDSVIVEYPSGHVDRFYNLPSNLHYYFREGETYSASITLNENTLLCPGESVTLDAGVHSSYLWNTGDTSQTISVNQTGTYYLEAWNAFGLSAYSDTLDVVVVPEAEVQFTLQHVSCSGAQDGSVAVQISTGPVQEIIWNTGATDTLIQQLGGDIYSFNALDSAGCAVTGEVSLHEPSPLVAQAATTDALCFGDFNGTAQTQIIGGTPPFTIEWNGWNPDNLSAGSYSTMVTDQNGCEYTVSFTIYQPDSLWLSLDVSPADAVENNGTANLDVSGGTLPYSIVWSTGATNTDELINLAPGNYFVWVEDGQQCTDSLQFTVGVSTSINDMAAYAIRIYPNPTSGMLQIAGCRAPQIAVRLTDKTGRVLMQRNHHPAGEVLQLPDFANGWYMLEITDGMQRSTHPLILQK